MRVDDRIALVVGGARDIGFSIARRLACEGAHIYLTGRDEAETIAAAAKIGRGARAIVVDAGNPSDLERAITSVIGDHGRIDVLVFNAAISDPAKLGEETAEKFERHFAVNVRGPLLCLQAALPAIAKGGAVVLIGSVAGSAGVPDYGTYAATKAALRSYARTWTAELSKRGIRVNVVSPGPTDTAAADKLSEQQIAQMVSLVPLGRLARCDEVAAAVLFLVSDEASFIAGAELCVDGGMRQV